MDQNWFYLIEQASDMSKIKPSFIIYACCLNKTTKTINELTNEQPRSQFFLTDPLSSTTTATSSSTTKALSSNVRFVFQRKHKRYRQRKTHQITRLIIKAIWQTTPDTDHRLARHVYDKKKK